VTCITESYELLSDSNSSTTDHEVYLSIAASTTHLASLTYDDSNAVTCSGQLTHLMSTNTCLAPDVAGGAGDTAGDDDDDDDDDADSSATPPTVRPSTACIRPSFNE